MRLFNTICRFVVGVLFVISGLVKLNDPYGTSYKLKEYFEVFAQDGIPFVEHLVPFTLFLSVFISGFEVILGIAILFCYRMKVTIWITLLLILFFTFLTFYSFYFNKVQECGCFGTAIKLTAKQSFFKDLILLVLILVLFINRNRLDAGYNSLKGHIIIAASATIAFGAGIYSIFNLPYFDTSLYKVGNNLNVLTKPKASPEYKWIMEKDGKEYEFLKYPTDPSYQYKGHVLLTDSSLLVPEISSFSIYNENKEDFTTESLKGRKILIIIANPAQAWANCPAKCMERINTFEKELEKKGFTTMILTVPSKDFEDYRMDVQLRGDYYFMDDVILKTMVRSNPGVMVLNDGVILGKWHFRNIPDSETINSLIK